MKVDRLGRRQGGDGSQDGPGARRPNQADGKTGYVTAAESLAFSVALKAGLQGLKHLTDPDLKFRSERRKKKRQTQEADDDDRDQAEDVGVDVKKAL